MISWYQPNFAVNLVCGLQLAPGDIMMMLLSQGGDTGPAEVNTIVQSLMLIQVIMNRAQH